MADLASLTKLFEVIVLLNCDQQNVSALPIDSKRNAVTVGRVARSKIKCESQKKAVVVSEFLATPHQSFDIGFIRLPKQSQSFFKVAIKTPLAGTKIYSLKTTEENRSFKLNSTGLVESCEHTKIGLTQLEALPAEERATHPDQDYGLHLWLRYCDLKTKSNQFFSLGRWKQYEVVGGSVLWSDEKNLISSLPLGPVGAPILNEKGELIAIHTALTPFKEPQNANVALSVSKIISPATRKLMHEAIENGLWDY